jgi:hypothetical protein
MLKLFRLNIFTILFILFLLFTGCVSTDTETVPEEKIAEEQDVSRKEMCHDWAGLFIGEFIIENNVWGKADITDYKQCIFQEAGDTLTFGWSWNWPSADGSVKAYPEIIYGNKPWAQSSTTPNLPIQLSEMNEIIVTYDTVTEATGVYNFAFDIWITFSDEINPENISREIMIWVNNAGMIPAGEATDIITIDGEKYAFYAGDVNTGEWLYVAFVKEVKSESAMLNIHNFLTYLIENEYMSSEEYLASIEFGNEIVQGSGEVVFYNYTINMN